MQEKTELLNTVSTQLGLNINRSKTRIMKANTKNNNPITMNGEPLKETFTYLGSTINKNGGTEEDVKARIQKARVAFIMLRKIRRAKQIKTNTKLRIFNSNVKAVFSLWIADMAKYTEDTNKNTTFINKMEVNRTYTQETTKHHHPSSPSHGTPREETKR